MTRWAALSRLRSTLSITGASVSCFSERRERMDEEVRAKGFRNSPRGVVKVEPLVRADCGPVDTPRDVERQEAAEMGPQVDAIEGTHPARRLVASGPTGTASRPPGSISAFAQALKPPQRRTSLQRRSNSDATKCPDCFCSRSISRFITASLFGILVSTPVARKSMTARASMGAASSYLGVQRNSQNWRSSSFFHTCIGLAGSCTSSIFSPALSSVARAQAACAWYSAKAWWA
mmetsp:Transcript_83816/g.157805  ORF Transcript_83816/g.157805 Transcript_83816/m.157805 type:complete len:233 (+) Transcript_83816:587-1285(+)